ncbi:hypothetical protein H1R20_g16194, partial [Candolleomyces eurysporus]
MLFKLWGLLEQKEKLFKELEEEVEQALVVQSSIDHESGQPVMDMFKLVRQDVE